MRVVVVSDTHMRTGSVRRLPDEVWAAVDRADLVLHAGDTGRLVEHRIVELPS